MKFLTGDETGIIKCVRVEAQKIERFGPQQRGDAVHRLSWCGPAAARESRVGVGYASGRVEVRDGTSGLVLGHHALTPDIKCLDPLGAGVGAGGLLSVSKCGGAGIVKSWCGDELSEAAKGEVTEKSVVKTFELPGPVAAARADPLTSERIVFGGMDNDLKLWDIAKGEVTWRAKNVREDTLCLKVPIKVSTLQWATEMAPTRSLILCGTHDGKIRLYDASTQRRPLFELVVGRGTGAGSGGYTGTVDEQARPLLCSAISTVRGDGWSIFVGNTMGVMREFDLRKLPECQTSPFPPGRKKHLDWAAKQCIFKRSYRGVMGSIRSVDVHCSGEAMVSVGIGRFAYVFETRKRRMNAKIYLKQKLCSVLFSSEDRKVPKTENSDDDGGDKEGAESEVDDDAVDDKVQEGFSSDEDDGEKGKAEDDDDDDDDDDEDGDDMSEGDDDSDDDESDEKPKAVSKKPAAAKVERQQTTVIMPDDSTADVPSKKQLKKGRRKGVTSAVPVAASADVVAPANTDTKGLKRSSASSPAPAKKGVKKSKRSS